MTRKKSITDVCEDYVCLCMRESNDVTCVRVLKWNVTEAWAAHALRTRYHLSLWWPSCCVCLCCAGACGGAEWALDCCGALLGHVAFPDSAAATPPCSASPWSHFGGERRWVPAIIFIFLLNFFFSFKRDPVVRAEAHHSGVQKSEVALKMLFLLKQKALHFWNI